MMKIKTGIKTAATGEPGQSESLELIPDTMWTYKQVAGKDLQLSVFLPERF